MQSYDNHRRWNPLYHFFAAPLAYTAAIWGVTALVRYPSDATVFMAIVGVGLGGMALVARQQALIVQNRVIRLEMELRLERQLPNELALRARGLTVRQLIALRFASDGELADLVRRTLAGDFAKTGDIKKAIKTWTPDELRA